MIKSSYHGVSRKSSWTATKIVEAKDFCIVARFTLMEVLHIENLSIWGRGEQL